MVLYLILIYGDGSIYPRFFIQLGIYLGRDYSSEAKLIMLNLYVLSFSLIYMIFFSKIWFFLNFRC